MTEGRPRPNRVRVKLHEANCAPEYVQAYLADEMDEYLDMLRAESAPAPTPAKDAWECAVKIAPIYCYPADYPGIDKAAAEIERYVESRLAEEREAGPSIVVSRGTRSARAAGEGLEGGAWLKALEKMGLAPDVLLIGAPDALPEMPNDPRLAPWLGLPVPATRTKHVYLVTDGNSQMPSVNIGKNVRTLAELIHRK